MLCSMGHGISSTACRLPGTWLMRDILLLFVSAHENNLAGDNVVDHHSHARSRRQSPKQERTLKYIQMHDDLYALIACGFLCFSPATHTMNKKRKERQKPFLSQKCRHSCTQNCLWKARGEERQFPDCKSSECKSGGREIKTIIMQSWYVV